MNQPLTAAQLAAAVRAAVDSAPTAFERADIVREVVRAAYDGVKMTWADCGRSDTEERSSLGDVVDQAEKHWATLAQQVHADFGPPGAT